MHGDPITPYLDAGLPWLRGNLHCHSTRSDGVREPQAVVDAYAKAGYDYLMLSDHDCLVDPASLDARGLVLIPGNEVTAHGPDILHVGAASRIEPQADRQLVFNAITRDGGFAVVNHPNWGPRFEHCAQALMEQWQGYTGIEIYNAVIRRLEGSPLATDRWDMLLSQGRRVWGFANDDSHCPSDDGQACNVVQCAERSPDAVVQALRAGRFYASTGVWIERIAVEGRRVVVETRNARRMTVVRDHGVRELTVDANRLHYETPDDVAWQYLRVECWGEGEEMAWTQPFFLEPAP